jgi:hypothetical protein
MAEQVQLYNRIVLRDDLPVVQRHISRSNRNEMIEIHDWWLLTDQSSLVTIIVFKIFMA